MPPWPGMGLELGCRALPLPVMDAALRRLVQGILRSHPGSLERMGPYADAIFLVAPTDLPIQFRIRLNSPAPVTCQRRSAPGHWDARITGPLPLLLAMLHGTLDGDALFFSREISIEGNTDAVLAMRNAMDAAEIDLPCEVANLFGPFSPLARRLAKLATPLVERLWQTALPGQQGAPA